MDFSIPSGIPSDIANELVQLKNDYDDGLLTDKGYIKKREKIYAKMTQNEIVGHRSKPSISNTVFSDNSYMTDQFSLNNIPIAANDAHLASATNDGMFMQQHMAYQHQHHLPHQQYQQENIFERPMKELQKPLDPRELPDAQIERFDNLPSILRHRATTYQKETAIMIIDSKGKEVSSISWEKLYLKSEKVAQQIKNKSGLYRGDRVCLIYQNTEVIEFTIALMGCFLAGVVAVPISIGLPIKEFINIMNDTQAHLCLMSDHVQKHFEKINQNAQGKIKWPKGVEWWKTTDMGTYQPPHKRADPPALQVPDLAYIEFSKSPTGELRGVVLSHRTIMHQMTCLTTVLSSMTGYNGKSIKRSEIAITKFKNVLLSTLDSRQSIGLIIGILFTIYTGNLLIWTAQNSMEVSGLYANIITKYKVSILLADYLGLKQVTYNYQSFPQLTRTYNKKIKVDLSCVRWCLINALTIDSEFHDLLTERWFQPLGCSDSRNIIAPMLTLSEHGGMVISIRDWLGNEQKLGCTFNKPLVDDFGKPGKQSDLSEVFIDKHSLMTNSVKVIDDRPHPVSAVDSSSQNSKYIRVGAFGYPLPDATLAIVNPESNMLSGVMEVGEIWIDSPSLSGGFWGLPKYTDAIFHARCKDYEGVLDLEFLRTGLLGFTYNGKIYVLGLYEDRLRQRVTWYDQKMELEKKKESANSNDQSSNNPSLTQLEPPTEYKYHYATHLVRSLARNVRQVSDCSFFDIYINKEYLPVAIIESPAASPTAVSNTGPYKEVDMLTLDDIASKAFKTLESLHNVRLYCILVTPPDTLPRTIRSGRSEIANMLCKRRFTEGTLPSMYAKFNISHSVSNIPRGKDIIGGIWTPYISKLRSDSLNPTAERQFSGLDFRDVSIDDRTRVPLTDFKTIIDILKWRSSNQPDELAFSVIDRSFKEAKPLTWKKFDSRVNALCSYIMDKSILSPGKHVILMYSLSEEFIIACYACFLLGLIPIPIAPIDTGSRLKEDVIALMGVIKNFNINCIFTHPEVESLLKSKVVTHAIKNYNSLAALPKIKNTAKYTKAPSNMASLNSKIAKWQAAVNFRDENTIALVWLYWSPDHYRIGVNLTHKILLSMCKTIKETCLMTSVNPLVGCVRHVSGLGFLQSTVLGVFLGSSTYLISPVDYSYNPMTFYLTLSKYKVKDAYITPQMIKHAFKKSKPKGFELSDFKNLMIAYEGRPAVDLFKASSLHFAPANLSSSSISHVYTHDFNPMITSRSYMSFDPIDLWLDPVALRQGYISIVNPSTNSDAIHVQDSGMVPVCTQIAIVNPETRELCKVGEYGEIWVCSESNVLSFTNGPNGPKDAFIESQFQAKIKNGNNDYTYLRTGDLGFLHSVSKSDVSNNGQKADIQPLFVLGKIAETIEVMGLHHFVIDIERSVESCHPDIYKNGSCIFRCSDFTILVVEPKVSTNVSALVPIIVNRVLNRHSLIVDVVVFVQKGTFPLSRLGEKQRAVIVDRFVNKKLPIARSFGIYYGENHMIKLIKEIEQVVGGQLGDHSGSCGNSIVWTNCNADTEVSSMYSASAGSYPLNDNNFGGLTEL
ncbi:hypothetical protein PACTADRAFT_49455 [Pachysolen tannophilus NRRL Y-2460]|uniref:DMAP1-binding domain-containing protein n=1 Tax=Pachysolen tannophilus NRRL Y-2460 TaxID=669874 RepID=A0A1E4TWJ5_PACTA|nr:hypothetical protein PACTADRAFT_49455 [Pachysolen tannophilus NRRL Y-2460]